MRGLIRKILREERNVDYTRLIQKLVDSAIVSKYPDDICKIEVEGNTKNVQYPRYWVSVIFKVSLNHLTVSDLARNIMDEIYTTVNDYFGIPPQMRSAFVRNCEEDITDLFEGEITERCWKGYTQKGMKTMFGKRYPNCVKKKK
jgi:hypothetical protein